MYATLFDDPDLINRMLPRYLAVTAEQIRTAAADVFRADNRVVLTYLPELPPADDEPGPRDDRDRPAPDERPTTRRSRHDRRPESPVVADAADARHARGPYDFPPFERSGLANGLTAARSADLPGRPLVVGHARAPQRRRRRAGGRGRRDGPRGAGADRGHRALRRDRARRGDRAARRVAPRRGRLGRDVGRRRRAGQPARAGARAARRGRRSTRRSRRPRSSGSATSA